MLGTEPGFQSAERASQQRLRFEQHRVLPRAHSAISQQGSQRQHHACGDRMVIALQPALTGQQLTIVGLGRLPFALGRPERSQVAQCHHASLMIRPDRGFKRANGQILNDDSRVEAALEVVRGSEVVGGDADTAMPVAELGSAHRERLGQHGLSIRVSLQGIQNDAKIVERAREVSRCIRAGSAPNRNSALEQRHRLLRSAPLVENPAEQVER